MKRITVVVLAAALSACAQLPSGQTPTAETPVSDKPVVVSLVDEARTQTTAGHLDAAARAYERALRIEPRNALLWHYLAQTRLQQSQLDQAEGMAAKSNTFAGDNRALRAGNWRLIGQARAQKGDNHGAEAAFAKATTFDQQQ